MGTVRIGCSGWVYDHWRGRVYPDGLPQRRWLEDYATLFDTVEVNATWEGFAVRNALALRDLLASNPRDADSPPSGPPSLARAVRRSGGRGGGAA